MLSAITFDLWNTLLINAPEGGEDYLKRCRLEGIRTVLQEHGMTADAKALEAAYDAAGAKYKEIWRTCVEIPPRDQITIMLSLLPAARGKVTPQLVADAEKPYTEAILQRPPPLAEGTKELLAELRKRMLRIGLISNTGRTPGTVLRKLLAAHGVLEYFDALVFSSETGVRKPAPEIFRSALAALGVTPFAALHVGDEFEADMIGAKRAGLRAVLLDRTGNYRDVAAQFADAVVPDFKTLLRCVDVLCGHLGKTNI